MRSQYAGVSMACVLLMGGSFDPVHLGHVGLAHYFCTLLRPDVLRLIPAGQPWQKPQMTTPAEHRLAMLHRAFAQCAVPVMIDAQEIQREGPSYTVETLRALRNELGQNASIVLVLGADQLQNLHTWHEWQRLFDYANLCVAARPGFSLEQDTDFAKVRSEFTRRAAMPDQIRATPYGLTYLANNLALDVSATAIRQALRQDQPVTDWLPASVLDYIQHHHLYKAN